MSIEEEQIQSNCEKIQKILDRHPERNITVIRKSQDYCYIKVKNSKHVIYTGNTEDTQKELRRYLEPTLEEIQEADSNYKIIQEEIKKFPRGTIDVRRININYYELRYKDEYTETFCTFNTGATFVNLRDMLNCRVRRREKENELLAETQALLNNSQYNWMEIRKTRYFEHWQVMDKSNGRVRFEDRADKVAKVVKEITQNQ